MATAKDKPDQLPEESAEAPADPAHAAEGPRELSPAEVRERHRAYEALRRAESAGDAEEARERIRAIDGDDAEIGDHVLVLADGQRARVEHAGATMHNGVPVVSAFESVQ